MGVRVARAVAVMIVAGAIGYAFAPLRAPAPFSAWAAESADGTVTVNDAPSMACGLSVIDAWRAKPPSGWFGYAPLTSVPNFADVGCRAAARDRLRTAGIVLLIGMFVALLAYASTPLRRSRAVES